MSNSTNNEIFVIMIDGAPHRWEGKIRTYKSRRNARREATILQDRYTEYGLTKLVQVGLFISVDLEEVPADGSL